MRLFIKRSADPRVKPIAALDTGIIQQELILCGFDVDKRGRRRGIIQIEI
jgi:hypothetical protein